MKDNFRKDSTHDAKLTIRRRFVACLAGSLLLPTLA